VRGAVSGAEATGIVGAARILMIGCPLSQMSTSSAPGRLEAGDRVGLVALVVGTVIIGFTPILVRFADVGPLTSAAWRMLLAVPALSLWMRILASRRPIGQVANVSSPAVVLALGMAGLAFAGDVASYHFALKGTSVANASFIGNISLILAVVGGAVFFSEHPDKRVWAGLALSLFGSWVMAGMLAPMDLHGGDLLAVSAAFFYCAYLLSIKRARAALDGPSATMWSAGVSAATLVTAALLFEPQFLPQSMIGWAVVLTLGFGSHTLGQGLTSVAIGRVPVGIVAVVVLVQPVLSTILAWVLLNESIDGFQIAGGTIILAALVLARPR
jgi:drug/metabolite transporter (DMT)-like permease